jgi:hypothetical protein
MNDFVEFQPRRWYVDTIATKGSTFWGEPTHMLDGSYAMADTPPNMKRMLLDNQRTILSAVLDFESKDIYEYSVFDGSIPIKVHHSSCIINEPPGSGKTIICIALMAMRQSPKPRTLMTTCNNPCNNTWVYKRTFPPHRVFPCTVVTVSRGVFKQWESEIAGFSDLKVLSIIDVRAFRKFCVMLDSDIESLRKYDVILIKNGKMSGYCSSGYVEPVNRNNTTVDLYRKFVEAIRGIAVWRVINDDIDMSKLPSPTSQINTYSTINISATKKRYINGRNLHDEIYNKNPWFRMRFPTFNINDAMNAEPYNTALCIRNTQEFVARSLQRVLIHFRLHKLNNPEANLINMIGGIMRPGDAADIMEMLNGEAFDDVTQRLHVQATSIGDIFQRMLGSRFDDRQKYNSTLNFINDLDLDTIDAMNEPPDGEVYYQKHFFEKKQVNYNYPGFEDKMNAVWDKCEEGLTETNIIIERFQQNICEGLCDICKSGLNKRDIVIMICCGKPYHQKCAFATSNIRNYNGRVSCSCPHCKKNMDPREAFVSINGCTLTDIVEYDEADDIKEPINVEETEEVKKDNNAIDPEKATKMDIMLDIINGGGDITGKRIKSLYGSAGFVDKGNRPNEHAQTLVFTRFRESIKKIEERLKLDGVNYRVLKGSTQNMYDIGEDFRKGKFRVLVVNGEANAAGRSFQYADRLIYMHHIADTNIATQIAGRIDRFGREWNGHIHILTWKESEHMEVEYL